MRRYCSARDSELPVAPRHCGYRFHHPDRTRDVCGLAVAPQSKVELCPLNQAKDEGIDETTLDLLRNELRKEDHWLEGILFPDANLLKLYAPKARMPYADFQNANLNAAILPEALLTGCNFTSASLGQATLVKPLL